MNFFKFSKPLSLYSIPLLVKNPDFPEHFTKCVIADLMSQIMSDTSNKFCQSKLPLAMSNLFSLGYE